MGKSAKIRHRRRRTLGWRREQARQAVLRDFQRKGVADSGLEETQNFKNLVEARLKDPMWR
jgi:hypothetical protein